jgi:CRISPR/Cas system CSM-associated protein Csm3 (group 7 of RAMP superfamily)
MIKAPFNFVPLDANIFFPSWQKQISQDVPFKGSLSGTIHVHIKAETPIFTRNGHQQGTEDNEFSYYIEQGSKRFFIPGSTVKGCIRSIVEIMSLGKMLPTTDSHTEENYRYSPQMLERLRISESADLQQMSKDSLDLAECIFGTTKDEDGLRGRVQFSHFKCTKKVAMPSDREEFRYVLNSPSPGMLPLYVRQEGCSGKYNNYDNEDLYPDEIMNGWKRYILRTGYWTKKPGKKDTVITTFRPLNKGSEFSGFIHYHNLKKEELGALLCALTWHGEDGCYHYIGQAKPFGFGRISIRIDNNQEQSLLSYIKEFEIMMTSWIKSITEGGNPEWRKYKPIRELFLLARTVRPWDDKKFTYMEGKESKNAKKNLEYLHSLSRILIKEKED